MAKHQVRTITASAPGKIILCGEHAVVYGIEAIACGIDLRTKCCIQLLDDCRQLRCSFGALNIEESWEMEHVHSLYGSGGIIDEKFDELLDHHEGQFQKLALQVVLRLYLIIARDSLKTDSTGLHINLTTDLPVGSGLGSSASLCVSVAASFLILYGYISKDSMSWSADDFKEINKFAYEGEKIVHGQPSGIDNTTITYGHFLSFQAGKIQCLPKLNQIKLDVLIVNTNVPRSTKTLVSGVRKRKEMFPDLYSSIFQSIGNLTEYLKDSLLKITNEVEESSSNYSDIEYLIDVNQCLLDSIGVGHADISKMIQVCRSHSLHGKLTGAGGGGCVFVILPPYVNKEKLQLVIEQLTDMKYECFRTTLGSSGVRVDD